MLFGDRGKYAAIVVGITFASLLIAQQSAIFWGLMLRTRSQIKDIQDADIWVMDPSVEFIDDTKPLSGNDVYRVRGVSGVKWAVPLYKAVGRARLIRQRRTDAGSGEETYQNPPPVYPPSVGQGGGRRAFGEPGFPVRGEEGFSPSPMTATVGAYQQVILIGIDDASYVGGPREMIVGSLADLRRPDAVIVDDAGYAQLWPGEPFETGKTFEMNDKRALLVGVCKALRTFQTFPVIYTRFSQAVTFAPQERKATSFVLAQGDEELPPEEVCRRIRVQTGLGALTREEFAWKTMSLYLTKTGILINFAVTVLLGFGVGAAISGQTFYMFTVENLKQFGALKAMGAGNARIAGMIVLQALTVGIIGYGLGVGISALFGELGESIPMFAFYMPIEVLIGTALGVVLMLIFASALSVRRVIRFEPAIVFQG